MSKATIARGLALALLVVLRAPASADTIYSNNVAPGDLWTNPADQQVGSTPWYYNADGGGSVGIRTTFARSGNGSAYLETTSDSSYGQLTYWTGNSLGSFSKLNALSYDWYRSSASTVLAHFAPALGLYLSSDGGVSGGWLIYEPIYNNPSPYSAPTDTWTPTDAYDNGGGQFWSTLTGAWEQKSLDDWKNLSLLANAEVYGVAAFIGMGIGNASFIGAADNVAWGFDGSAAVGNNFEVVPEPSSIAMGMIAGGLGLAAAARRRFACA